jgi:hypothetical protein
MGYAQDTTVPVERSKAEIERVLTKYQASQFVSGWDERQNKAMVQFEMRDRRIRIMVDTPTLDSFKMTKRRDSWGTMRDRERTDAQMKGEREKELKRRWRALLLVIKAKLEAVESGISTFEEEFLPYVVTASGRTIGEMILPKLDQVASSGRLPPLLPGKTEE